MPGCAQSVWWCFGCTGCLMVLPAKTSPGMGLSTAHHPHQQHRGGQPGQAPGMGLSLQLPWPESLPWSQSGCSRDADPSWATGTTLEPRWPHDFPLCRSHHLIFPSAPQPGADSPSFSSRILTSPLVFILSTQVRWRSWVGRADLQFFKLFTRKACTLPNMGCSLGSLLTSVILNRRNGFCWWLLSPPCSRLFYCKENVAT